MSKYDTSNYYGVEFIKTGKNEDRVILPDYVKVRRNFVVKYVDLGVLRLYQVDLGGKESFVDDFSRKHDIAKALTARERLSAEFSEDRILRPN